MNLPFFIAKKIASKKQKSFSAFIIRVAIIAVALSVSVMIIGTAVTRGYQNVITEKFYNCWGHIHITNFLVDPNALLNDDSIPYDSNLVKNISQIPEIKSINTYRIQSALLKTKTDLEGVLLKGVRDSAGFVTLSQFLREGKPMQFDSLEYSKDIVVSESIAQKFNLKLNESLLLYFIQKNEFQPKIRKVTISGIYKTGLEDYDKLFLICDSKLINSVNDDDQNTIQGYEIALKDKHDIKKVSDEIYEKYLKEPLQSYTIEERFSNVFSWLGMMKMNEQIIIIIMMIIAIINMVTAILILILERTQMIGIFKSLGMKNTSIQLVFLYTSLTIVGLGALFGTILGVGLCLLQQYFGVIKLDEATYFVKTVPVSIEVLNILVVNIATLVICFLLLIIPSFIIRNISPTKALKFN